jgi:hypothetical protein
MTLCDDCVAAERDPHGIGVTWKDRPCCIARAIAGTVGRSGKGYTVEDVRAKLLARLTSGLAPQEAQWVRGRADDILRARKEAA